MKYRFLFLVALFVSCADPDPDLSLLGPDDDWEERRTRMNVVVIDPNGETVEQTPGEFLGAVLTECQSLLTVPQVPDPNDDETDAPTVPLNCAQSFNGGPTGCLYWACWSQAAVCASHRLLEIAESPAPNRVADLTVPPQSQPARTGMLEQSQGVAASAAIFSGIALSGAGGGPIGDLACTASDLDAVLIAEDLTSGESLATSLNEAYYLAQEAARAGAAANTAAADEELSRQPSLTRARETGARAPVLSRGHAAHLLVGGQRAVGGEPAPALDVYGDEVPFTQPRLSASSLLALDAIRAAAPNLAVLEDPAVSDDALAVGLTDSIRVRLLERFDQPDSFLPADSAGMFDALGFDASDFAEARRWIVDEARAFPRDRTVVLDPLALPSGIGEPPRETTTPRYAATAQPPARPESAYWAARACTTSVPRNDSTMVNGAAVPTPAYALEGLAQTMDYVHSIAATLLDPNNPAILPDSVVEGLSHILAAEDTARPLRAEVRFVAGTTPEVFIRAYGDDLTNLSLVQGGLGLECATTGLVEGQPCDLDDFIVPTPTSGSLPTRATGFQDYLQWDATGMVTPGSDLADDSRLFFVVENATMDDPDMGPGIMVGPANARPLVGAPVPDGTSDYVTMIPGTPEIPDVVEEAIAFEPPPVFRGSDHDAEPTNHCSRLGADVRLPLENSLASDADPLESSWRIYLDLAARSAAEADALADELLAAGVSLDQRAEVAMSELEEACGAAVDLDFLDRRGDDLLGSGTDDPLPMRDGDCAPPSGPDDDGCTFPYSCRQGSCILDVAATLDGVADGQPAEIERLRACISPSASVPFVALGDETVCVWVNETNPNEVCGNPDGSLVQCPFLLSQFAGTGIESCEDLTGRPGFPGPADARALTTVDRSLGLFETTTEGGLSGAGTGRTCLALRQLRDGSSDAILRGVARNILEGERNFDVQNVQQAARALGWEDEEQGYGTLTLGDQRFSTGSPVSGPTTLRWPCAGSTPPVECRTSALEPTMAGFFCGDPIDCGDFTARSAWQLRGSRAVLAAQAMAGVVPGQAMRLAGLPGAPDLSGTSLTSEELGSFVFTPPGGGPAQTRTSFLFTNPERTASHRKTNSLYVLPNRGFERADVAQYVFQNRVRPAFVGEPTDITLLGDVSTGDGTVIERGIVTLSETDTVAGWPSWYGDLYEFGTSSSSDRREEAGPYFFRTEFSRVPVTAGRLEFSVEALLDGTELLCEATRSDRPIECGVPPEVRSIADLAALRDFMDCSAARIEQFGKLTVFSNVPESVVDVVDDPLGLGAFPETGGSFGIAVTQVREALLAFRDIPQALGHELRQFSGDLEQTERTLDILDLRRELDRFGLIGSVSNQITNCAVAIAGVVSASGSSSLTARAGAVTAAAATCANTAVNIAMAVKSYRAEGEINALEQQNALGQLRSLFNERSRQLQTVFERAASVRESLNAGLVSIESTQRRARRAVAQALFLDSDEAGRAYRVNRLMRRRLNTLQARYDEAKSAAIRLSYLARLAVEQRIGMPLNELGELPLVEDPARWVDELCTLDGIDYERIRDESLDTGLIDYSNGYIGDYVRRLERIIESYRLAFPFSDGSDTSVLSLRDEILNVRAECEVDGPNELFFSSALSELASPVDPGWHARECGFVDDPDVLDRVVNCVTAIPVSDDVVDPRLAPDDVQPVINRVVFGDPSMLGALVDPTTASVRWDSDPAGLQTRLAQTVVLEPNRLYRLSWYGEIRSGAMDPGPAVAVIDENEVVLTTGALEVESVPAADPTTPERFRFHRFFDTFGAPTTASYLVVVEPDGIDPLLNQETYVGGFMLEDVSDVVVGSMETTMDETVDAFNPSLHPPRNYHDTRETLTRFAPECEDTDGVRFRREWTRQCIDVCPTGATDCDAVSADQRCYWSTNFNISIPRIENGTLIHSGGFARGNYNYRHDALAVNFVGVELRDCSGVRLPSTCFATGNIPFSIHHTGGTEGFAVRNHRGEDTYQAPLFDGRIEHGRGLAAERYVTNPLSGADRALLSDYSHRELAGRPLTGSYELRVWEEPGVRFDRLEDVQLILDYRFWTRLD